LHGSTSSAQISHPPWNIAKSWNIPHGLRHHSSLEMVMITVHTRPPPPLYSSQAYVFKTILEARVHNRQCQPPRSDLLDLAS